ncbi:universal stress protein [Prevotella sp. 10(H)]|uniref:universal stress protein n=1 Tax=Prevotella sp. 10(H) TaxID=1158294 RepID=UPI0004A7427A|nr:universal stress protein [Prevotella sp. 10(H)]
MDDKLITLAIHTPEKARILKYTLEDMGVDSILVDLSDKEADGSCAIAVRISASDLTKALTIIESAHLFRYNDDRIQKIDDGRKRILVPIDFSPYSLKACRIAFAIAHQANAKVKILHVYKMRFPITFPFADAVHTSDGENMLDSARREMLDFCYEIDKKISEKDFPSVNYSYSLREGPVEEEIENFIDEYKPFLLVLGTKGKSNSQHSILGNVTADIIEMTNVPVMVVPENSQFAKMEDIKHIAFLTNFQKRDLESFDYFVTKLKAFPSVKITFVHVNAKDKSGAKWTQSEMAGMEDYFRKKYPEVQVGYKVIDAPDMVLAMSSFIKEEQVNIVALNTKRRNLFGRIFLPSVSRKLLTNFDVNLLIFRG